MLFNLARWGLTALLAFLALYDIRARAVPNLTTLPLLFGGAAWHLLNGEWAVPVVLALILLASERRLSMPVAVGVILCMILLADGPAVLIGASWLIIWLLWEINMLGGGDAKLAMGLVGLFPSLDLIWLMLFANLIGGLVLLLVKYRSRIANRLGETALTLFGGHLPTRDDLEEHGQPMAFVYAAAGILYLWSSWKGA